MTFVKKGVVIPLGSAGEVDDRLAYYPNILKVGNKYFCYYTAYDGSVYRIALAISKDGVNFIKKGVVLNIGPAGEVDDIAIYLPNILKVNGKYYCYYTAYDGSVYRIALAISKDGVNFIKKGVVLNIGSSGEVDDISIYSPNILRVNNKCYYYYTANDGSIRRISLAISQDGVNFIKKGVVLNIGPAGEVDDIATYLPNILKVNGKYYCYYTAYDGSVYRIALAISKDGVNFIKKGVVLNIGSSGEVDDISIYSPNILRVNNKCYCYYTANDGSIRRILLAISQDGG